MRSPSLELRLAPKKEASWEDTCSPGLSGVYEPPAGLTRWRNLIKSWRIVKASCDLINGTNVSEGRLGSQESGLTVELWKTYL